MLIRFTEFFEFDGHDLNLYVVQESEDSGNLCFRVYIKDGSKGMINICRKADDDWQINSEEGLQGLNEIKPLLISAINKRITRNNYSNSTRLK